MQIPDKNLLDALVELNILDAQTASTAQMEALKRNVPLVVYLQTDAHIPKASLLQAIGKAMDIGVVDLASTLIDTQSLGFVPQQLSMRFGIVPVAYNPATQTLSVATSDPFNINIIDFLEKKTQKKINLLFAFKEDIENVLKTVYAQALTPEVKDALKEVTPQKQETSVQQTTSLKEAPVAKIVNTILEFAVQSRASDIHIEPGESKTRVRYRIDGVLYEKLALPRAIHDSLVSRIKILSEMKIDEKRIPQDGRFNFKVADQDIDLRVSTLPTVQGEKIVMRLLKKTGGLPSLIELGLRGQQLKDLEEVIQKPNGIVLVTGPTGSGKTTTLYSVLSKLNTPKVNILTLEDPVEYQIPGLNQIQINPQAGLTFSTGLRSFLRQDPNIILVGEIRDTETTQLAVQAALTGHLVFSTLHTNDAATAIPRLIDLKAEPFLIVSVLNASMAQRIVRRICDSCKRELPAEQEIEEKIRATLGPLLPATTQTSPLKVYKGEGCSVCGGTGYKGRIGIYEVLKMSPAINALVMRQATAKEIEAQAIQEGMVTLMQDGFLKVLEGITTVEEILRVAVL